MTIERGNLEKNYTLFDKVWRIDELLLICSNYNKFRNDKNKFIDFTKKSFFALQLLSPDLILSNKTSEDLKRLHDILLSRKVTKEYKVLKLISHYSKKNEKLIQKFLKIINLILDKNKNFLKFVDSSNFDISEGSLFLALHFYKERNKRLVNLKKQDYFEKNGNLQCEICKFDFFQIYGNRGFYFAEVHHDSPISTYSGIQKTMLRDLSIVCSNCHKMIHRKHPWPKVKEFKKELNKINSNFAA